MPPIFFNANCVLMKKNHFNSDKIYALYIIFYSINIKCVMILKSRKDKVVLPTVGRQTIDINELGHLD